MDSNAVGQSSSVPSSNPIGWVVSDTSAPSAETRQVERELDAPGRPVMWDIVPPHVELVTNPLCGKQIRERTRAGQGAGGVRLPGPATDHEKQADPAPQPGEV